MDCAQTEAVSNQRARGERAALIETRPSVKRVSPGHIHSFERQQRTSGLKSAETDWKERISDKIRTRKDCTTAQNDQTHGAEAFKSRGGIKEHFVF